MIRQSVNDLTVCEDREPVVLVLDYAVQVILFSSLRLATIFSCFILLGAMFDLIWFIAVAFIFSI